MDVTDAIGIPVHLDDTDFVFPRRLVFVKIVLCNVISQGASRHHLGSVVVGDTLVPVGGNSPAFALTKLIPYWQYWVRNMQCTVARGCVCACACACVCDGCMDNTMVVAAVTLYDADH